MELTSEAAADGRKSRSGVLPCYTSQLVKDIFWEQQ